MGFLFDGQFCSSGHVCSPLFTILWNTGEAACVKARALRLLLFFSTLRNFMARCAVAILKSDRYAEHLFDLSSSCLQRRIKNSIVVGSRPLASFRNAIVSSELS
ncbi:MAG: hypothetical protein ND866_05730, partial [Pyrinomonadaceae bacterium]|nr:hypothetical protein [Pyrinomonadaceae bacterium]